MAGVRWSELSARERDALVAEQVMGQEFTFVRGRECGWVGNPKAETEEERKPIRWFPDDYVEVHPDGDPIAYPTISGFASPYRHCPSYSTDIAAAWEAAEKVSGFDKDRENPWLSVSVVAAHPGQYGCLVYPCPPGHRIWDVEEVVARSVRSDAPDAVCIATLRAVGVEVED